MEPWTWQTNVLDSELALEKAPAIMLDFPEDGSEWLPGVLGRALAFDGLSQAASHHADLPRDAGTIGHWLRPDVASGLRVALYTSDFQGAGLPDYNGYGSVSPILEIHTGIWDGDYYAIWQDGPVETVREVRGGEAVSGRWSHVALTWSVPGALTLYVDCEPVATAQMDAAFEGRAVTDRFIGRGSQPAGRTWSGAMDEVIIWPGEFSATQIRRYFCPPVRHESSILVAPTPAADGLFGYAAAMDGDWLLVRSLGANQVHWYRRQGLSGLEFDSSMASTLGNEFLNYRGRSVDVEGARAAAASDDQVVIMELSEGPPSSWEVVRSVADNFDDFGAFGNSLALSGDTLAVGSPGADTGAVYIFERNEGGPGQWGRTLFRSTSAIDGFGELIDLDGDLLVVLGKPDTGLSEIVQIFERNTDGPNAWGEEAQLDSGGSDLFSLALRGDRLAVSSFGPNSRGLITVYRRDLGGPGAWGIEHYLLASQGDWNDGMGFELIWLDDETIAASTRSRIDYQVGIDHPAVYVFRLGSNVHEVVEGALVSFEESLFVPSQFDPLTEQPPSFGHALAGIPGLLLVTAPRTGSRLAGSDPLRPVDSGRIHLFTSAIFVDGFETVAPEPGATAPGGRPARPD